MTSAVTIPMSVSSTSGERWDAAANRLALASSSALEFGCSSKRSLQRERAWGTVNPVTTPAVRAVAVSAMMVARRRSPSSNATGLVARSGRSRRRDCSENSATRRTAKLGIGLGKGKVGGSLLILVLRSRSRKRGSGSVSLVFPLYPYLSSRGR